MAFSDNLGFLYRLLQHYITAGMNDEICEGRGGAAATFSVPCASPPLSALEKEMHANRRSLLANVTVVGTSAWVEQVSRRE
jgi:hypothetical protein